MSDTVPTPNVIRPAAPAAPSAPQAGAVPVAAGAAARPVAGPSTDAAANTGLAAPRFSPEESVLGLRALVLLFAVLAGACALAGARWGERDWAQAALWGTGAALVAGILASLPAAVVLRNVVSAHRAFRREQQQLAAEKKRAALLAMKKKPAPAHGPVLSR